MHIYKIDRFSMILQQKRMPLCNSKVNLCYENWIRCDKWLKSKSFQSFFNNTIICHFSAEEMFKLYQNRDVYSCHENADFLSGGRVHPKNALHLLGTTEVHSVSV